MKFLSSLNMNDEIAQLKNDILSLEADGFIKIDQIKSNFERVYHMNMCVHGIEFYKSVYFQGLEDYSKVLFVRANEIFEFIEECYSNRYFSEKRPTSKQYVRMIVDMLDHMVDKYGPVESEAKNKLYSVWLKLFFHVLNKKPNEEFKDLYRQYREYCSKQPTICI